MKSTPLSKRSAQLLIFSLGIAGELAIGRVGVGKSVDSKREKPTETASWRSSDRSLETADSTQPDSRKSPRNGKSTALSGPKLTGSFRNVLQNNMEEERLESFKKLLQNTSPKDFPEIVSLIREIDLRGAGSGNEWSALWAEWGRRDPKSAVDFIKSMDWGEWNHNAPEQAMNQTMIYWADSDLNAALNYFETVDMPAGNRDGLYGLIRGWSARDPDGAAAWLFKTGLGMDGEFGALVEAIGRSDGTEAVGSWFEKIAESDAPQKDIEGLAVKVLGSMTKNEPEQAAALIERNYAEEWTQNPSLLEGTADAYAAVDATAAMDWAERIESGRAQSTILRTWAGQDSGAAIQWLNQHQQSPGHTSLAFNLAYQLTSSDLAEARKVALTIQDPTARDNILGVIAAKEQN